MLCVYSFYGTMNIETIYPILINYYSYIDIFFSFALINVLINNGTHFMWLRIKWTTAYIHTYIVIHRLTKMKQMPWVNLYYIPNAIWAILHGLRKFVSYLLTLLCASHIYKTEISNIRQFIRCMCVCNMYDRISVYKMKIRKSNLFINFMNCVIIWYKHKSNVTEFSGNSYLRCVLKITTFSHPMKWIFSSDAGRDNGFV